MRATTLRKGPVCVLVAWMAAIPCIVIAEESPPATLNVELTDAQFYRGSRFAGTSYCRLEAEPRETEITSPIGPTDALVYGCAPLGDDEDNLFSFVLGESRGPGTGIDVLYFDANNNEDLTDDPLVRYIPPKRSDLPFVDFEPFTINVAAGGQECTHRLYARYRGDPFARVSFTSLDHRTGTLPSAGKDVAFILVDEWPNARFNDPFQVRTYKNATGDLVAMGDCIVIDSDGDRDFERGAATISEMHHIGKYFLWDGACYETDIAAHGHRITFTPTQAPCGTVTLGTEGLSVELVSDAGGLKVSSKTCPAQVPAGAYRVCEAYLEVTDESGKTWRNHGKGQRDQVPFIVEEGKTKSLPVGPPFTAEVEATKKPPGQFQFNLVVRGRGGERYDPRLIACQMKDRPKSTFRICDKNGAVVAQGTFDYG